MKLVLVAIVLFFSISPAWSCADFIDKGYHLGKDNWIFRKKTDFQDEFVIRDKPLNSLIKFKNALQQQGIELIIALLPTRGIMHADQVLNQEFDAAKALNNYRELVQKLNASEIKTIGYFDQNPDFYYSADHHWTADGARAVAKKLSSSVEDKNFQSETFQTEKGAVESFEGSFQKEYKEACDDELSPIETTIYHTLSQNQDLFSDKKPADVVLIGTSNSDNEASRANFDGFLKQNLSADIYNASISGGGFDTAMLQYLTSNEYKNHKPKLMIWEFPVYQNFNDTHFYAQAVPAVYGSCGQDNAYKQTVKVSDNKFSFDLGEGQSWNNHYIILNIESYKSKKFRLELAGEEKSSFNIERSKFYDADGIFYYDLCDYPQTTKILGMLPSGSYEDVELAICRYSSE